MVPYGTGAYQSRHGLLDKEYPGYLITDAYAGYNKAGNYMRKLFPSKLLISATTVTHSEMKALYDTHNCAEKIRFAYKKWSEGYTVGDIALLLHSCITAINKYLAVPEDKIPEPKEVVRERQH